MLIKNPNAVLILVSEVYALFSPNSHSLWEWTTRAKWSLSKMRLSFCNVVSRVTLLNLVYAAFSTLSVAMTFPFNNLAFRLPKVATPVIFLPKLEIAKKHKTGVINDPLGQATVPAGSEDLYVPTYERTCVNIVITTGLDCGLPRGSTRQV